MPDRTSVQGEDRKERLLEIANLLAPAAIYPRDFAERLTANTDHLQQLLGQATAFLRNLANTPQQQSPIDKEAQEKILEAIEDKGRRCWQANRDPKECSEWQALEVSLRHRWSGEELEGEPMVLWDPQTKGELWHLAPGNDRRRALCGREIGNYGWKARDPQKLDLYVGVNRCPACFALTQPGSGEGEECERLKAVFHAALGERVRVRQINPHDDGHPTLCKDDVQAALDTLLDGLAGRGGGEEGLRQALAEIQDFAEYGMNDGAWIVRRAKSALASTQPDYGTGEKCSDCTDEVFCERHQTEEDEKTARMWAALGTGEKPRVNNSCPSEPVVKKSTENLTSREKPVESGEGE